MDNKTSKTQSIDFGTLSMQRIMILCGVEPGWDFEMDSRSPEKGGQSICGKLGRKHRMKRWGSMSTTCIYPGCDACC